MQPFEILMVLTAHDETFAQTVTARTSYKPAEVVWNARFADMFVDTPDGVVTVDLHRLDRIEHLPEGSTSRPPAPAASGR